MSAPVLRSNVLDRDQQDCGEMPLALLRKCPLLRFAVKVRANPHNPASDVTVYNWRADAITYQLGEETMYAILQQYQTRSAKSHLAPRYLEAPPWHMRPPRTDLSLKDVISEYNI